MFATCGLPGYVLGRARPKASPTAVKATAKSKVTPTSVPMRKRSSSVIEGEVNAAVTASFVQYAGEERGCLNGVAQKRYRHPRPSQKRGHHASKVTQGIEPFLTKSQLREHEGERERNKGKGEHRAECERNLHCAHTVGKRPARDDSHRARERPDAQHERQACYEHSGAQAPRARGRHEHAPANILLAHLGKHKAHADHNGAHDGVRAET